MPSRFFLKAWFTVVLAVGCAWFELWRTRIDEAVRAKQTLVVFYFGGHLAKHGMEGTSFPRTPHVHGEVRRVADCPLPPPSLPRYVVLDERSPVLVRFSPHFQDISSRTGFYISSMLAQCFIHPSMAFWFDILDQEYRLGHISVRVAGGVGPRVGQSRLKAVG